MRFQGNDRIPGEHSSRRPARAMPLATYRRLGSGIAEGADPTYPGCAGSQVHKQLVKYEAIGPGPGFGDNDDHATWEPLAADVSLRRKPSARTGLTGSREAGVREVARPGWTATSADGRRLRSRLSAASVRFDQWMSERLPSFSCRRRPHRWLDRLLDFFDFF
jgi:hypothetical protein